ncbi:MAG: ABC transporter substrate-binding protein [Gloeotrichia echinulata DVL01]
MTEANYPDNPYIIGSPIDDPNKFFGRQELFRFIESNLLQGSKVILLHGQRRIGKSSVLYQIPKSVFKDYEDERNPFSFIFFDLQSKSSKPLADIIRDLAIKISTDLQLNQAIVPTLEQLEDNTDIFVRRFLPQVYQELGNKNLVLLLDEFDVLDENHPNRNNNSEIENKGGGFFRYLQLLVNREQKLFIIPVVGRHVGELPNLVKLFKGPPNQNIELLDQPDARQLISKPVEGMLEYREDAIQAILELSAGHPYFTQVICFNLFIQAKNHNHTQITGEDVKGIVEQAIETAEGGLDWFWNGLSMTEQVVFSAVAKAEFPEDPFTVLRKNGVIETELLIPSAEKLVDQRFVDEGQPDYTQSKVKVEFVRRWLRQRHSLDIEIWKLEKIEEQRVEILRNAAHRYHEDGNNQKALQLYEDILKINPNHFSTVLDLAEGYSNLGNFEKAIEYYTRAYQFDPLRNTDTLVQELENYASHLFTNRHIKLAKQQYQRVLDIQPERKQAEMRLKEIEAVESKFLWRCEGYKDEPHQPQTINMGENCPVCNRTRDSSEYSSNYQVAPNPPKRRIISPVILGKLTSLGGMIALAVFGTTLFSIYRFSTPCPAGEKKEFGVLCHSDMSKISRGERTLFPSINNTNRDQGIEAYKRRNYAEAAKFFKGAVEDAKNDPEVLIYYNNALAHSKGSFITLAVVVPVDKESIKKAQEILRGVAQAQNQFNQKNGLNGRLLEIAIANDGTKEKDPKFATSQQVAQELVKDENILGVIGHNSSDATKAALSAYENAKIPVISSTSTSTSLSSNFFFRTVPSDAASGKKLAEYAIKSGLRKAVIFANNDSAYSDSLREKFQSNFERLGGEVVKPDRPVELNDDPQLDDGKAIPVSIFRYQAQVAVLFPDVYHTRQAVNIARANANISAELMKNPNNQFRGLKLLGGDALYGQEILDQGGKDVEGLVLAVPWFRDTAPGRNFALSAQQQWGAPVSWRTATSYDATQAFIKAIQSASTNLSRETVLQALRKVNLSPNETSGVNLQFTSDGERQSEPVLVQVKDGKFIIVP